MNWILNFCIFYKEIVTICCKGAAEATLYNIYYLLGYFWKSSQKAFIYLREQI